MLKSSPPASSTAPPRPKKTLSDKIGFDPEHVPATKPLQGKRWSNQFAAAVRWLHIYVSLLSFTALVFFGATGITLNHPDWFDANAQQVVEAEGQMSVDWVRLDEGQDPETLSTKLEVVEHLRSTHQLRGAVSEFRVDERECLVLFKGPGYASDAIVDRETGKYRLTTTMMGMVAIMNDLHKGRDTGGAWSIVIDVVSGMTVFVSITGLILIFYLKRKRVSGTLTAIVGTLLLIAVFLWLIP
jgi:hypothetical protein